MLVSQYSIHDNDKLARQIAHEHQLALTMVLYVGLRLLVHRARGCISRSVAAIEKLLVTMKLIRTKLIAVQSLP